MENQQVKRIVVSCMDRRLPMHIDSNFKDNETLTLSSAGPSEDSIRSVRKAVCEHPEVEKIELLTHGDCGASGVTYTAKYDYDTYAEMGMSQSVLRRIVNRYGNREFGDKEEITRERGKMLREKVTRAISRVSDAKVELGHIDIGSVKVPTDGGEHSLLLLKPSTMKSSETISRLGLERFSAYVVQSYNLRDVMPDIEMALKALHIKKVFADAGTNGFNNRELASLRRLDIHPVRFQ